MWVKMQCCTQKFEVLMTRSFLQLKKPKWPAQCILEHVQLWFW
uniref:Uncharacterized protein n=1 Tax=Rhizophora mucronata TaxID=61149 RepID=A0A2P2PA35_RHIMU